MEAQLLQRGIPLYEATEELLSAKLLAMDRLGIPGRSPRSWRRFLIAASRKQLSWRRDSDVRRLADL